MENTVVVIDARHTTLLRPGHVVAQGQTPTYCECDSVAVHFYQVNVVQTWLLH
jgi:hypothetical protein